MKAKILVVGLLLVVALVLLSLLAGNREGNVFFLVGGSSTKEVQIVNGFGIPILGARPGGAGLSSATARYAAISQLDRAQYNTEEEWRTWSASACSPASISIVLNGFGFPVRVTDILVQLREKDAISSSAGLFRYDVFEQVATKYGLKAVQNVDKNIDAHFDNILKYLKQGTPVIINILDPIAYPGGHFMVATGINPDGTIAVLNPYPGSSKGVVQAWQAADLKPMFARRGRSIAYLPGSSVPVA